MNKFGVILGERMQSRHIERCDVCKGALDSIEHQFSDDDSDLRCVFPDCPKFMLRRKDAA